MSSLLELNVDGDPIYIEVETRYGSEETSPLEKATVSAQNVIEKARNAIAYVATHLVGEIRSLDEQLTPDEFEFQFSIKFNVEGNVILSKINAESIIQVTMLYKHREADKSKPSSSEAAS